MSNIIEFVKRKNRDDDGEWLFNLAVYGHGKETSCFITGLGDELEAAERGDRHRAIAERLDDLSFLIRQHAEEDSESERGEAIAVVTVFAGGHVQTRLNVEKVVSPEQREWVRDQLILASEEQRA